MNYCSTQNLIDLPSGEQELIQLTDRDNLGVINEAVLAKAIADAGAEMNGYLTRYKLPLTHVPENFVRLACDITLYHLYRGRMLDEVERRYNAAIKYLEQIAAGKITLAADVVGIAQDLSNDDVAFAATETVFSPGLLENF
jgi:phage gp36-like protein